MSARPPAPDLSAEEASVVARFEVAEYPAEVEYVNLLRREGFVEGALAGIKLMREGS